MDGAGDKKAEGRNRRVSCGEGWSTVLTRQMNTEECSRKGELEGQHVETRCLYSLGAIRTYDHKDHKGILD